MVKIKARGLHYRELNRLIRQKAREGHTQFLLVGVGMHAGVIYIRGKMGGLVGEEVEINYNYAKRFCEGKV